MGHLLLTLGFGLLISAGNGVETPPSNPAPQPAPLPHHHPHHGPQHRHQPVVGILQADLLGIGGETTGFGILTQAGMTELVISNELKAGIRAFNGKAVVVMGKPTTLTGVETGERKAIDVRILGLYSKKTTLTGKLSLHEVAIGGETTGASLDMGNHKVEVILLSNVKNEAKSLDGKTVTVVGVHTRVRGPELHSRPALLVESIAAASE